jgi:dipeptidyl aminopeptidase/acylaminoacyl peptidase
MTALELWRLPRVGAPAVSADGTRVVVPVTTADLDKNESVTRLWLVAADGPSAPRALTAADASATSPALSPDGRHLAFLRKPPGRTDAKPQLWWLPLDGGEAEMLADLPLGVADPRWFPDGRRIAFLAPLLASHLTVEATRARLVERDQDPVKAQVTEDRVYRFWDRWLSTGEVPHLFVVDVQSRAVTDLTPDSTRWLDLMETPGRYDIAPDGAEIAFAANSSAPPHMRLRWALWAVPASGGPTRCLTPDNPADDDRPRYHPDGRSILFATQREPHFYADRVRLARHRRDSGAEELLTDGWDRSVTSFEVEPSGAVALVAEDRGRSSLFRLRPGAGEPELLVPGGFVDGLAVGGERLFYTRQGLSQPAEVFCREPDGAERQLTRFTAQALDGVALGEVLEAEVPGAGGRPVQAYVVLPPGFDPKRRWPLVHVIHGGPHGVSGDQFHPRWNAQVFAGRGQVVAMVNFHGSTSWGQDFTKSILGAWGERPTEDVERTTDWLLGLGFVDDTRMAVTGGSYGGYLVSWITAVSDRYACAVCHAGVSDTLAMYATDITQSRHVAFGGEPWDGLEHIDRWNPARHAHGYQTPTLVVHGERDYRVPVTQGLALYNVLRAKGVAARLVYFPDENHWVLKPRNSVFWYGQVLDWLDRFLRPGA